MRRLLIITTVLFFSILIFSQDNEKKNQNVELPDFVITGKDVISLQKANKIDPGFVSTISEDFIKPLYSSEDLGISDLSNPIKDQLNFRDTQNVYNTRLTIGTGIYTSPKGRFSFTQPFNNVLVNAVVNGENHRAFVDNSDWYKFNGALDLAFYMPNDAALRGTQIKFHGDYGLNSYRFYASNYDPSKRRNYYKGNFSAEVNNLINKQFIFSLKTTDSYNYLQNEDFSENLLKVDGFFKANIFYVKLGGNFNYTIQYLKNSLFGSGNYKYYSVRPFLETEISNLFKIIVGLNYSKKDLIFSTPFFDSPENYLSPYAAIAFRLNDFISIFGEYNPHAEFLSVGGLLSSNRYFNTNNFANAYVKKTADVNFTIKYEYYKYFEIDLGAKYFNAEDLPYFTSASLYSILWSGRFDVNFTAAKNYSVFVNLLFHPGPYGVFYGTAEYNDTKDNAGHEIPYSPMLKATMSYGYNFGFGFSLEPKLYFYSQSYTDIANLNKLDSYIDLGVKFAYKFGNNFSLNVELSNLADRKNYEWDGYRESPLDLVAGFTYQW